MKKIIEILGQARFAALNVSVSMAVSYIEKAVDELTALPRWETPEQREKRTGEAWPDTWAVYIYVIDWPPMMTVWKGWKVMPYGKAKTYIPRKEFEVCIICATESGPPPDNWEPE
jgi:hypothetical protein